MTIIIWPTNAVYKLSVGVSDGWTDARDKTNSHLLTILEMRIVKDKYISSSSVFEEHLAHMFGFLYLTRH